MYILDRLKQLAQGAELYSRDEERGKVHIEGSHIQSIQVDRSYGRALRVFKNGKIGFGHTSQVDTESDARLIERALSVASHGQVANFELPGKPGSSAGQCVDQTTEHLEIENVVHFAKRVLEQLRSSNRTLGWSTIASYEQGTVSLVNSAGFEAQYDFTNFHLVLSGLYTQEDDIVHYYRKWSGKWPMRELISTLSGRVNQELNEISYISKMEHGAYQVVFSPLATKALLHTVVKPITGKNANLLSKRIDKHILDPKITLVEDPTCDEFCQPIPFDDEGVVTRPKYLFKEGVFVEGIHSLATASSVECWPTGNGLRPEYSKTPRPKAVNLFLSPGSQSVNEIVANVKNGVYIVLLGNTVNSNFRAGQLVGTVGLGYRIMNGERVGRIKNAALNLNGLAALKNQIIAISSEREWVDSSFLPSIALDGIYIGSMS